MSTKKRTNVGNRTKIKMCGTDAKPKIRLTKSGAAAVREQRIAAGAFPASIAAYPCPWCGSWHVGTRRPEEMRNRRRRK